MTTSICVYELKFLKKQDIIDVKYLWNVSEIHSVWIWVKQFDICLPLVCGSESLPGNSRSGSDCTLQLCEAINARRKLPPAVRETGAPPRANWGLPFILLVPFCCDVSGVCLIELPWWRKASGSPTAVRLILVEIPACRELFARNDAFKLVIDVIVTIQLLKQLSQEYSKLFAPEYLWTHVYLPAYKWR